MPLPLLWTALLLAPPPAASATAGAALEPGPVPTAMQPTGIGVDPPVAIQDRGRKQDKGKRGSVGGLDDIRRAIKRGRKLPRYRDPLARKGSEEEEAEGEGAERAPAPRESRVSDAQLGSWYETCDANQNGWVSFGEARASMRFDRPRFRAYDADRDGRLQYEEYEQYYLETFTRDGSFLAPLAASGSAALRRRSHDQIRIAYDFDLDGRLSLPEVTRVLADYGQAALDPQRVVRALDSDGDGFLELAELEGLPSVLYPVTLPTLDGTEGSGPTSIDELFGAVEARETSPGASPAPPRIVGPVRHFRRLDLDDDGSISVVDLEALARPIRLSVRIPTILNTLDRNLDGVLSEREFLGALMVLGDE